jgi:hypothetical protein
MGRFEHDNQLIFKFIGYNSDGADPYSTGITYSYSGNYPTAFVSTPTVSPTDGWLNGTLKNIGADIITYTIVVEATTVDGSITKNFEFTVVGNIDTTVTWNTQPDLGTIDNGSISDLTVQATFGEPPGEYRLASGALPPGLEILSNGGISGRVEFNLNTTSPYVFTVEAYSPVYPTTITSLREFTLTVVQRYPKPYDTIYMGGLLSIPDRIKVERLINHISDTQENNIYRPTDPYFGIATSVRYQHQYGVPSVSAISPGDTNYFYNEYLEAVQRNFYWKFLTLGSLSTAIATDSNGNVIYEVVYSNIIDNLVNAKNISISKKVGFPNPITTNIGPYWTSWTSIYTSNTYYDLTPLSKAVSSTVTLSTTIRLNNVDGLIVGMQVTGFPGVNVFNNLDGTPPVILSIVPSTNTVELSVAQSIVNRQQLIFSVQITVANGDVETGIDLYPNSLPNMRQQIAESIGQFDISELLPRWMNSQQSNGQVLGFTPCWVLCYTKPGMSATVLNSIKLYLAANNLTLNQITFQIDRITIDRSLTYTYGSTAFDQWPPTQPSVSVDNNSQDSYINFPRKTIL